MPSGELAGYVQATVTEPGVAYVAYVLASRHWRQGIGSAAVAAMLAELKTTYSVSLSVAVLKTANYRSIGLLRKLGFLAATRAPHSRFDAESDDIVMVRPNGVTQNALLPQPK